MRANLVPLVTGDFILFLNFVILKSWQNLHPKKKKKAKFTLGKTSNFFGSKKKNLIAKTKQNTASSHLLLKII